MTDRKIFKALLKHEMFKKYQNHVTEPMFSELFSNLYKTLVEAQKKYKRDLTTQDIYEIYIIENPLATDAKKALVRQYLEMIDTTEDTDENIFKDILASAFRKEMGRQIGIEAMQVMEGNDRSITDLKRKIEQLVNNTCFVEENLTEVTNSIDELLKEADKIVKYHFNIPVLLEHVNGIGPGIFTIVGARPEVGKTLFWLHLCAAPGGFLDQGAKVIAFCNEEPGVRVKLRSVSSMTGIPAKDFPLHKENIQKKVNSYGNRFKIYDAVAITMQQLENIIETENPDIVIVDQADKIVIGGTYARPDERLRDLYVHLREIAKSKKCAVVGISQLSAEAEGKLNITLDMFENSRTGKAAEGDLIIGIGKRNEAEQEHIRQLNVLKNKITGEHPRRVVTVENEISRYAA